MNNSIVFEVCFRLGFDRIVVKRTTIPPKSRDAYSYFPRVGALSNKKNDTPTEVGRLEVRHFLYWFLMF